MKINFKKIAILFVGIIAILLGLLWFLQGADIIQVCPILCFADCKCIRGGSLLWEIIGPIVFFIGIGIVYFNLWPIKRDKTK